MGLSAHFRIAMIAARMFLPPTHVGLIVDKGYDFPSEFEIQLRAYGEMAWLRARDGPTTRADGHQTFKYLSPQLHLTPKDLILPPSPFAQPHLPEYIHVVSGTLRAKAIVEEMSSIRREGINGIGKDWKAKIVWEPLGFSCVPSELENFRTIAPHLDMISPNLIEARSILALPFGNTSTVTEEKRDVENVTRQLRDALADEMGCSPKVIVRAGKLGAYTISDDWEGWTPAFWREDEQGQIADTTGGGNAYLGGLCAGLLLSDGDLQAAGIYAAVGASFAIQQRGSPHLVIIDERETWNGTDPWIRVRGLVQRVSDEASNFTPI
ncbi:hypothetical protein M231_07442 [Tremella mesenterica]|uniref:Carbohydrate kinase PfkB domain-containing protein n=1 Tax=Tremella mesenterica TaxID=5217 RepID=A0A4Q1BFT0_TREME|nr:hypothetical protein M231_07442 [Tremella mesenterica]